jgi:dihydrofolate reductase
MTVRLIAAIDTQRGIATDSGIPWKLAGDTAYFREKTSRGLILMGRATYEEFAAPLHGRENFVLTRRPGPLRPGFLAVTSLDQLRADHPDQDVWVIGGGAVYAGTIGDAEELLITQVLADFHCTRYFPPFRDQFVLEAQSEVHREGEISYRFETWRPMGRQPADRPSP